MTRKTRQETRLSFDTSPIYKVFVDKLASFTGLVSGQDSEFISVRFMYRGQYDYMAVAKRYGPDGTQEVCFGSGPDFVGCLLGLEASIDQGKWRPDKYAQKS